MVHVLRSFFLTLVLMTLPASADYATVIRVVDGDTLSVTLNGQPESVRLIGVDTPEFHDSDKLHRDAERTGQDAATIQALGRRASDMVAPARGELVPGGEQSGEVRGNRNSKIYHLPSCPGYATLSAKNIVPFSSEEEAQRAGYRKAKNCP